MEQDRISDEPSTAALGHHPIHPMLIPFPIAFLTGALGTDLAYWRLGDPFWARASFWLLLAGLATGALAGVFGLIDFLTIRRARSVAAGWVHLIGNVVALALAGYSIATRWGDPGPAVVPAGLVHTALIAALLVLTGWLGGELSYRYKIGVAGYARAEVSPAAAVPSHRTPTGV